MAKSNNTQRWILITAAAVVLAAAGTAHAGYTLTTLASFNGSDGANPFENGLVLSGSTLYGVTDQGGAYGDGTVFSVPITGGTPTVLTSFNGSNGARPSGSLTLSGNTLYGVTEQGGDNGAGTVFSLPITGGTPTILTSFNGSNGANPAAGVIISGNNLYGTATNGGANGYGTVFSVPITGGTPTVLVSFNGSNLAYPYCAGLTLSGSTLYGTTYGTGPGNGNDTVFSLPIAGGTPIVLASFNGGLWDGVILSGSACTGLTAGAMCFRFRSPAVRPRSWRGAWTGWTSPTAA